MQLQCMSPLERRIVLAIRANESLPASDVATQITIALGDAGEELQRLRHKSGVCGCGKPGTIEKHAGGYIYPWCGDQACLDTAKGL